MTALSAHTNTILEALRRQRLGATPPAPVRTPLGGSLVPGHGRYAIGQTVLSPGLDDCSPRHAAEVLAVGTREDHPGTWYLLRSRRGGLSMVQEDALRSIA